MRIYLGGYLTFYAAGQHWVEVDVPAPGRLREVLKRVAIPVGEVYLTVVNGVIVDLDETQVSQSDEVRLYPPVDGGARGQAEQHALTLMDCRLGCGACCVAPSISTPIPGLPRGKPAGVRCVQLTGDNLCRLFGRPERPAVCVSLKPSLEMCGQTAAEACAMLAALERTTQPTAPESQRESHDRI